MELKQQTTESIEESKPCYVCKSNTIFDEKTVTFGNNILCFNCYKSEGLDKTIIKELLLRSV